MYKIIKLGLAFLFILALFDMPYGYFQLLRFLAMLGFGILGYSAFLRDDKIFLFIYIASALLINPFIKIALGRTIWMIFDVLWATFLIISLKIEPKNKN